MAQVERCVDCLVKEVVKIQLHPMNFSRDGRFMLSRTRQQYFTPFPRLRTVITVNIPTTRTAYTALLFSEVKYNDQTAYLVYNETCVTLYANTF